MMRNFAVFGLVAGRYFWLARGAAMTLATSENWSLSIVASLSWPPQLPPFPKSIQLGLERAVGKSSADVVAANPGRHGGDAVDGVRGAGTRGSEQSECDSKDARDHGVCFHCWAERGHKSETEPSRKRCARWCCGGCGARRTHADAGTGPGGPGSMALTNGPERPHMAEMPPRRTRMQFKLSPLPPLR